MSEGKNTVIAFHSIFGAKSQKGAVELHIDGKIVAQMSVPDAKKVISNFHGAIEAAISDEMLVIFLKTKIGLPHEAAMRALLDFRTIRQGTSDVVIEN